MMLKLYPSVLRPLLFRGDPERVHDLTLRSAAWISTQPGLLQGIRSLFPVPALPALSQTLWGLRFAHPLGLAAGFDKNGQGIPLWAALGFAFAEIGTVTAHPQPGNPHPRLFRLPADQAILNRLGFNNWGSQGVADHLARVKPAQGFGIPLGINLGKSKITPLAAAAQDYLSSWQRLYPWGDYFVVNVSSPNTEGLRTLQAKDQLQEIVGVLQGANPQAKPILVKIAPDLDPPGLDAVIEVVQGMGLAGIIATNTTLSREGLRTSGFESAAGGISGSPLGHRATKVVQYLYQASQGQIPIIGVGGVNSAAAAWEKLAAGANLVQVYTGLVYEGPGLVAQILRELSAALAKVGIPHLSELTGSQIPYPG